MKESGILFIYCYFFFGAEKKKIRPDTKLQEKAVLREMKSVSLGEAKKANTK